MNGRRAIVAGLLAVGLVATPARADYGPPTAVRAAHAAELHRWHLQCPVTRCRNPSLDVIVIGRFALIDWTTSRAQGQSLLEYAPSKGWYRLAHGGGEMGEGILAALTGDDAATRLWAQYQRYRRRQ